MTAEQLLLDERFLAWAEGVDDPSVARWIESLRFSSPEQEEELLDALTTYQSICREEVIVSGGKEQLERLMDRLDRSSSQGGGIDLARPSKRSWATLLLVSTIVGVFGLLVYLATLPQKNTISGDGKLTKLSDGTKVILAASSTIRYAEGFEKKSVREVWVKGEAQFDVAHKKDEQPFLVHTNLFDIEVTGTRFIVNNHDQGASVLLQEGSVNLIFPNGEMARMKPGDFFTLKPKRSEGDSATGSGTLAELERQLVFENTPLIQVAREIERRYEVSVQILSPGLNEKLITGILPNNDLTALLKALQSAMDCSITQENQTIYIKSSL